MGQMTYAVLYGVKMKAPKHLGEDRWYALIERYKQRKGAKGLEPAHPCGDDDFDGIGFWCAVGASGEDGVPDLAGFPLDDFAGASKAHKRSLDKAKEAWAEFATWCSKEQSGTYARGTKWEQAWTQPPIAFPEPRLYLVQTEVA